MLFKEIPEDKFSLGLAVRLGATIQGNVNGLIQEPGQFLGAAGLDRFLHLAYYITLG